MGRGIFCGAYQMKDYTWRELEPGNDIATCVSFPSRGAYFAVGDEDGTVNIWAYTTYPVITKKLTLNKAIARKKKGNLSSSCNKLIVYMVFLWDIVMKL